MVKSDIEAFEIYKNVYFVGSSRVSVHIVKTAKGLVMIDTGYPDMYDQILSSMADLGLDPKDLCAIIHSHGHIDHIGCTIKLKEISNAKTYISVEDNEIVNGNRNLSGADFLGLPTPEPFSCDVLVKDGDVFDFGDVTLRCLLTPGHTEGVLTLFFTLEDGTVAAMHGGVGMNSMQLDWLNKYSLPLSLRDDFAKGIKRLRTEKVDLVLGNHPYQNDTPKLLENTKSGISNIDTEAWQKFLDWCDEKIKALMAEGEAK